MQNSDFRRDTQAACDVLVIGCGYLGRSLTRLLLAEGRRVTVTTRSRGLPDAPPGLTRLPLDLADPASIEAFGQAFAQARPAIVFILVPPGGDPAATLVRGPARLLDLPSIAAAGRIVVSSSTAVYGDHAGEWVSAETPPSAQGERARWLLEGEAAWCTHPGTRVLRLAGLYGPGRLIGEAELRAGAVLAGDPERWLNLIHVEDAAALLLALARPVAAARVELGSDGSPVRRGAWYAGLARVLGLGEPRFDGSTRSDGPRGARPASRRCDPASTFERVGWKPRYPDWRAGLAASLAVPAVSAGR